MANSRNCGFLLYIFFAFIKFTVGKAVSMIGARVNAKGKERENFELDYKFSRKFRFRDGGGVGIFSAMRTMHTTHVHSYFIHPKHYRFQNTFTS